MANQQEFEYEWVGAGQLNVWASRGWHVVPGITSSERGILMERRPCLGLPDDSVTK